MLAGGSVTGGGRRGGGRARLRPAIWAASVIVAAPALVLAFELREGVSLAGWGIVPRNLRGLAGLAFSPLLHADGLHWWSNAVPLWGLLVLLFWDPANRPGPTLGWIWVGSGMGTWLIGRGGATHIGASSLVFGVAAFLVASGWFQRRWRAVLVALAVWIICGPIFRGALPSDGPVSWEAHLSGLVVGVWRASALRGRRRRGRVA